MSDNLIKIDESIRKEADEILGQKGLQALLENYGIPHVTGSYVLQLIGEWHGLKRWNKSETCTLAAF